MPSTHPRYETGRFIHPPDMEHINEFLIPRFVPSDGLTGLQRAVRWAEDRRKAGNPLPDGQAVLTMDDYRLYHWRTDRFVPVLPPPPPAGENISGLVPGAAPRRSTDWHQKPVALTPGRIGAASGLGRLPNVERPFRSTLTEGLTFEVAALWQNHYVAQVTADCTLTFDVDVDVELICVGAGGPGQDWTNTPWPDGTARGLYHGGAGGGAGAVSLRQLRVRAGQQLIVQPGAAGQTSTYDRSCSYVTVGGDVVLLAPGGQPYQQNGTYRTRADSGDALGNNRVTGSACGTAAEARAIRNALGRLQPYGTRVSSPAVYHPNLGGLPGVTWRAYGGSRGAAVRNALTSRSSRVTNLRWVWLAGAGGGAGGDAPEPQIGTTELADLTLNREQTIAGARASNAGGPGVSIPWWPTARKFAYGGPAGSQFGAGNTRTEAGARAAGAPTEIGSGGAGGGAVRNPTSGALTGTVTSAGGANGAVLVRWPQAGRALSPTLWSAIVSV